MTLPVTSLLAGAFALLMVALSLPVSLRRITLRSVQATDAQDEALRRRIRAHGNFTEYAPTELILVGLIELSGGSRLVVAGLAIAFFLSRVFHALGMLYTASPILRRPSMITQHVAFIVAGVWLISTAL